MTLIEPDLDLESDESETWDLDLIEWDSDASVSYTHLTLPTIYSV